MLRMMISTWFYYIYIFLIHEMGMSFFHGMGYLSWFFPLYTLAQPRLGIRKVDPACLKYISFDRFCPRSRRSWKKMGVTCGTPCQMVRKMSRVSLGLFYPTYRDYFTSFITGRGPPCGNQFSDLLVRCLEKMTKIIPKCWFDGDESHN